MRTGATGTTRAGELCAGARAGTSAKGRAPAARVRTRAGATASLRRLAFAVTGAAEELAPAALVDALEVRIRAARDAGHGEAAAAFDAAGRGASIPRAPRPRRS